jgi:glycosyltransferase involved in cell wall biosynthesis
MSVNLPIRILFNVLADEQNVNAQSLNARDIALRLDPERFESTMFVLRKPDPRLLSSRSIHLIHLPPRLGSLVVAAQLIWGQHDILFYPPYNYLITWYNALVWMGKRKKVIATAEGTAEQLQAVDSPLRERLLHRVKEADACYAISPHIAQTMFVKFDLKMGVVPIGVDTTLFSPLNRSVDTAPTKVLYVGSIQPRKQIELLLDLAKVIKQEIAEFHIIGDVIGTPAYCDSLLRRKAEENLEHVHFHGKLPQLEVGEWMHRCDIFILPSRLEGTPKVIFEAAASGLPCIVFHDYHTPAVVNGVTGFEVKSFEEMLKCLRQLIQNKDLRLRMGSAAVRHTSQFEWKIIAKRWEQVFVDVASTGRSKLKDQ